MRRWMISVLLFLLLLTGEARAAELPETPRRTAAERPAPERLRPRAKAVV